MFNRLARFFSKPTPPAVITPPVATEPGLFFSYKNKVTVDKIINDLKEELVNLQSLTPTDELVKRHRSRHECYISTPTHIYELEYEIEGVIANDKYVTAAISEAQARGLLEDHIVRNLGHNLYPIIKNVKDYGTQPIEWCIEFCNQQIEDVTNKALEANQ